MPQILYSNPQFQEAEALYSWLQEINQTDCYQLFLQSGYDKPTISRMTPEVVILMILN